MRRDRFGFESHWTRVDPLQNALSLKADNTTTRREIVPNQFFSNSVFRGTRVLRELRVRVPPTLRNNRFGKNRKRLFNRNVLVKSSILDVAFKSSFLNYSAKFKMF